MKDGGPAFPSTEDGKTTALREGMSLRDWFAGQALADSASLGNTSPADIAKMAYEIADAMLDEREESLS